MLLLGAVASAADVGSSEPTCELVLFSPYQPLLPYGLSPGFDEYEYGGCHEP